MNDLTQRAITWISSQLGAAKGFGNIPANLDEITQAVVEQAQKGDITLSLIQKMSEDLGCDPTGLSAIVNLLTASKPPILEMAFISPSGVKLPLEMGGELIKNEKKARETLVAWRIAAERNRPKLYVGRNPLYAAHSRTQPVSVLGYRSIAAPNWIDVLLVRNETITRLNGSDQPAQVEHFFKTFTEELGENPEIEISART